MATRPESKRLRIQGDLDEISSAMLRTYVACKGEKATTSGAAVALLEEFFSSPVFMEKLETAIRWASEENKQKAIDELKKIGITPPKSLEI